VTDSVEPLRAALADRYPIERELGHGGMATVYLAHDARHGRRVALKVLHPALAAGLGTERFLREVRIAAGLQHPHILPVHDSGEAAGRLYYVMPYVEGETLRARLNRTGPLPVDESVRLAREVLDALGHAHRHEVVHRDIKPENLLLSEGHALVADFGIAKALVAAGDERLTETGWSVGTPPYMSPEQIGGEAVDGRSDLYGLACVLQEMLTGEPPFTGATAQELFAKHVRDRPPPLRTRRPEAPPAVEQAIGRALAKEPDQRFATAAEFARALSVDGPELPRKRRSLRGTRLGLGALLIATLAVGLWRALRSNPTLGLDADLVAVAPFDVLDPKLEVWREGLIDILARDLDGAGSLRTVSPTVVIRRWQGHSDPVSAKDLARHTGAGLVLYGQLARHGPDSARLAASLLDVTKGKVLAQFDRPDAVDRVDRLADSLTIDVLRSLGPGKVGSGWRQASMGTQSLPALNAFLRGEQYLRRAAWHAATAEFARAIELDTGFALAIWEQAQATGWSGDSYDDIDRLLLRAGARNRGLAPRDSLLITADSLDAAFDDSMNPAAWTDARRRFSTLDVAVRRYSTDPLVWYHLGEARYHGSTACECEPKQMLEAFDRVIQLDSAFAPAYIHAIQLANDLNDPTRTTRYLQAYLALQPTDYEGVGASIAAALLENKIPWAQIAQRLDTASDNLLFSVFVLSPTLDSVETTVRLLRLKWPGTDRALARRRLAHALAFRGHLHEAFQNADTRLPDLFTDFALFGTVSSDSAATVFQEWLAGDIERAVFGLRWWISTRDTASLVRLRTRADSTARRTKIPSRLRQARGTAELARAALVLARGDSAGALRRFVMFPDSLCPSCRDLLLLRFQLLAAADKDREASAVLDRDRSAYPSLVLARLTRGRVAERLGDREKAVQSYQFVVDAWRNADSELRPYVREAKAALARLTETPPRNAP
jgi:serine/threonine-protein kinase